MAYMSLSKTTFFIFLAVLTAVFFHVSFASAQTSGQTVCDAISPDHFLQSDTFLVKVPNEKSTITGTFGLKKVVFFRPQNAQDWMAIVGISIHKPPGIYKLTIYRAGKELCTKNITVDKKDFPITQLVITPQQAQQGYTAKKLLKNINSIAIATLNTIFNTFTVKNYITKPFVYPLASIKVTGDYGDIRENNGYKIQHLGVDLQAPIGTPVYAVNDGKVVFEKSLPDYGKTMVINHGRGIYSLYLHLSKFNVAAGEVIQQKDVIAYAGDTGYVLGPHLHFSIKYRGASVDPLKFVEATQTEW